MAIVQMFGYKVFVVALMVCAVPYRWTGDFNLLAKWHGGAQRIGPYFNPINSTPSIPCFLKLRILTGNKGEKGNKIEKEIGRAICYVKEKDVACQLMEFAGSVWIIRPVLGRDRLVVKHAAEQLRLEGSYIPRTYIEQIQLEKLVKEVMALPEDLKTKLSLDEDLISSSADRVAWRNKNLKSGISRSYSNQRDKNFSNFSGFDVSSHSCIDRTSESVTTMVDQGVIMQLSEQISTLNDRMDEFTSRVEELSSKLTMRKTSPSQQSIVLQSEACNGSAPTSYFLSNLSNGSLTGPILPNSSSSSQLIKDSSPLMEEESFWRLGFCVGKFAERILLHSYLNLQFPNELLSEPNQLPSEDMIYE
ncbi:Inorganic pyrophosphatase ttm2 [Ancistrocladus abbreviatus]